MRKQNITISTTDRAALLQLVRSARLDRYIPAENVDALNRELSRAEFIEPAAMPADVVTMNSTVWFRDLEGEEVESYTLVSPHEADALQDRISVLAPIGTALLGYRAGNVVEWHVPRGKCRIEIVKVVQPWEAERAGQTELLV